MTDKQNMINDQNVKTLQTISLVSGLFILLVSLILIFGYLQLRFMAPLDNPVITELKEQFDRDQTNQQLKEQIRALDLMARRAFFSGTWQVRAGSWLLLLGAIVFLTTQRLLAGRHKAIPSFPGEPKGDIPTAALHRRWIIYPSVAVVLLAIVLSLAMRSTLPSPARVVITGTAEQVAVTQQAPVPPPQERVPVTAVEERVAEVAAADAERETGEATGEVRETAVAAAPAERPVAEGPAAEPRPEEKFPFFRGPGSRGFAVGDNYPLRWDGAAGTNLLWKVTTPKPGFSSPAIWGNKLFITGADKSGEEIYCYDAGSGTLLWRASPAGMRVSPAQVPDPDEETGLAAPTVAVTSRHVAAIFATGNLFCTDHNGNQLWAVNLGMPDNHYGHSSSLIAWQNLLLVQFDHNEGASLMAFDLNSGNKVWETKRETLISWASPVLATIGGVEQVILTSHPYVAGYDPATGRELWRARGVTGEVGPSPGVNSTTVFVGNEYASVVAIDVVNGAEQLWEDNEILPEVSSLVATDEFLFVATSFGAIGCYQTTTGELLWEHYYDYGFYSSPIIVGDKVYLTDKAGVTYIFRVAAEFEEIAVSPLGERVLTTPAFAGGRIFIRGSSNLYCIGER